ncbi:MAG TPA: DNA alkylation repair protein [Terriglobales bacterium]|nr:DNA alkylation repair protein [Terriglobales bacterium]
MKKTPAYIAAHIRRVLVNGASAPHTEEVQRFFKDEIQSRGWYTHELRRVAVRLRKATLQDADLKFLLAVCDKLFRGRVLEEKIFAVLMLQGIASEFGDREFKLFTSWLDRISTWADHDALASYLLGPMIAAEAKRAKIVFQWAKSRDRWHRRAAAVSLIRAIRLKRCRREVIQISNLLLKDQDDMVQKGLGWLLREAAKCDPEFTIPYLRKIRTRAPRLVLRTACETLSPSQREEILGIARKGAAACAC